MRRTPTFLAATAAAGALAVVPSSTGAAPNRATLPDAHELLAGQATDVTRDHLVRRVLRLARKVAAVQGRDLRRGYADALRTLSTEDLAARRADLRRDLRRARRKARERERGARSVSMPAHLAAIAQCESGGNPAAIGGGGAYRGLFQFSPATWQAVGGSGDPAAAPVAEQVKRAQILYERSGPGQWPVCGA